MAALTLDQMAAEGKRKMDLKASSMTASWNAAKSRMKSGFADQPFGPTRKANFNTAVDNATHRVDNDKWLKNWLAKMRE